MLPTGAMRPKSLPRTKKREEQPHIELNFKGDTFEEAISQAIVAALGSGMSQREIIAQLIARDFLRDPGNNALEDVVRALADMAEQMRSDPCSGPPLTAVVETGWLSRATP